MTFWKLAHRIRGPFHFAGLALLLLAGMTAPGAEAMVLYDPNLASLPTAQGWLFAEFPGGASAGVGGGELSFDSGGVAPNRAGFFNLGQTLDANLGYRLSFDLSLVDENHTSPDRSGFSLIAVSSDVTKAIELGFWTDEVWAQNDTPLFTHGEGTSNFSTVANDLIRFDLVVQGMFYELFAGGNSILSGAMRDYTAFSGPVLPLPPQLLDPYEVPNLLFFGDDTFSASATVRLGRIELNPLQAVPEPSSLLLFGVGALFVAKRFRLRRR